MKIRNFNLEMSKESERDYMNLSPKDRRNVIRKIKSNYLSGNIRKIAFLKDYKLLKRVKSGNFRIVIFLKTKTDHEILMIGDRKEVYDRVKRKGSKYR